VQRLALRYHGRDGWIVLRELRGHDEDSVEGTDSEAAIALLDRLLIDAPDAALGSGQAAELTVPDRDRLLAAVQVATFGPRIESTVRCRACGQPFDLDFRLDLLLERLVPEPAAIALADGHGLFRLPDGRRFRLPRGIEERMARCVPRDEMEAELLRRCVVEGPPSDDLGAVARALREVGPLVDLEVEASCPECGHAQGVRFDLQHFVLKRILDERRLRALEVHRLARAYHWALAEILELPRSRRRLFVELIERDQVSG
jgi:hypothetical protein